MVSVPIFGIVSSINCVIFVVSTISFSICGGISSSDAVIFNVRFRCNIFNCFINIIVGNIGGKVVVSVDI